MSQGFDDEAAESAVKQGFAFGLTIVAAALLFVAGVISVFVGISALNKDTLLVLDQDYVFELNLTAWGWIHIVIGVLAVVIAGGLAIGADWARVAAIIIAALSIITQFLWLPHYPAWSILIIALDVILIWAVCSWNPRQVTHGRTARR
ncbi:hypothetical protein [Gordonia polyisoprenivorans]|uniref:DUF7144 family membrane protein n=1 Tax=Gordonia polyisoprenivorans TaxID=84595 RepID=UPI000B99DF3C|nr:hypothetical protein [Gordonia polyisoprenivorans]OZC34425.1 hypothetical protein CJJ17_20780 [Gordonia polyisoprenivorans]WCB38155.1 hypothetical protein PHA63_03085 [Gordonia polyisoprenivorans]